MDNDPLLPPAPGDEMHENDVLKRKKTFSWRRFGGDGFLASVAFHVLLLLIGLFYVIRKYTEPKKPDTEVFATGAGGGANGEKARMYEHKMRRKVATPLKSPSRIVSKSADAAIALPSTPATTSASFASGLSTGDMSKGSGGGSGGGVGTGMGVGRGGGRNFVSLFGARGVNLPGLPGTFYDGKQKPDGSPSKYAADSRESNQAFGSDVLRRFFSSWQESFLDTNFFKAPERLVAGQIFIPAQSASAAPLAYGVADKVKPGRWIAYYRGLVTAPKTGKFRFWGFADDSLTLRWSGKNVLDTGMTILSMGGNFNDGNIGAVGTKPILGSKVRKGRFNASAWIDVVKNAEYTMDLTISEVPGGAFGAWLMMEEAAPGSSDGDGRVFLVRFNAEPLPPGLEDSTGLGVDMSGKGLVWKTRAARSSAVR